MDTQPYVLAPRSPAAIVEDQFIRLFKRCVQCPPITPSCNCAAGQTCSLVSATCNACQFTVCTGTATSSGPPVAAIVGGVIGGLFILAVIAFLALRFRKHRQQEFPAEEEDVYDTDEWQQMQMQQEKEEQDRYSARMNNRMSARTTASTASSAVSGRASNMIKIAYIPGVINRSQSQSDLAPPIPPIPAASALSSRASPGSSNRTSQAEQFMFLPDLRNSTYSDYSARSSVAASRASFASTVYRNDAIVNPMPATAVNLLKPTSVSVKGSSTRGSPSMSRSSSPPVGSSSPGQQLHTKSSIVGKMAQPRAITVTRKPSNSIKPHGSKAFELDGSDQSVSSAATSLHQRSGPASPKSNAASTFEYIGSDEDDVHSMNSHLVELPANRTTMLPVIPPVNLDPAELSESSRHSSIPRAIHDSMMKAMQINMGPAPAPDASPFSDAHESRTP